MRGPGEVIRYAEEAPVGGECSGIGEGRTAREVSVRVPERHAGPAVRSRRQSAGEIKACCERQEVRHRVPLVAGYAAPKQPGGGPNRSFAVAERIPCEAEARREVIVIYRDAAPFHARISVEQHPDRCVPGARLTSGPEQNSQPCFADRSVAFERPTAAPD